MTIDPQIRTNPAHATNPPVGSEGCRETTADDFSTEANFWPISPPFLKTICFIQNELRRQTTASQALTKGPNGTQSVRQATGLPCWPLSSWAQTARPFQTAHDRDIIGP